MSIISIVTPFRARDLFSIHIANFSTISLKKMTILQWFGFSMPFKDLRTKNDLDQNKNLVIYGQNLEFSEF